MFLKQLFSRKVKSRSTPETAIKFYDKKAKDLPRLIYRRLAENLAGDRKARQNAIAAFKAEYEKGTGDYLKLKGILPQYLSPLLSEAEQYDLTEFLNKLTQRRVARLKEVFPHVSDEFSTDNSFLNTAFYPQQQKPLSRALPVFTIGSCFARNIATFLQAQGYDAHSFKQSEDLNSPLSNARMLTVATMAERRDYLQRWITMLDMGSDDLGTLIAAQEQKLDKLLQSLKAAKVLIITIGNIIDYFMPSGEIAPKFLTLFNTEDIDNRAAITRKLKAAGATLRLANFAEAKAAIRQLYDSIRHICPAAAIIFTLSPVPIDSAMGLEKQNLKSGAIELDCISKATLRAALHEVLNEVIPADGDLYYFPSFEIVRWVAPMTNAAIFGMEDASSRHVSNQILVDVYKFFLLQFADDEVIETTNKKPGHF